MSWDNPGPCELCGATANVRVSLVHWKDALPGMAYEHVPRCVDRAGCKRRVLESGQPWPLVEKPTDHAA